jgi:glycosyltransferase involved in cell wall biosynthesis
MKKKGVALLHPTGNANVRAALDGLQEHGLLSEFYTTVASFPGNAFDRLGRISAFSEFSKRKFESRLEPLTRSIPFRELSRLAASKAGLKSLTRHETGVFSIDAVYRSMDAYVSGRIRKGRLSETAAVYAYEDEASESFRTARSNGLKCLYDLPIGYWRSARKLLASEREARPEWAATLTGFLDSEAKLQRKDEELKLADHIFVASSFTAATLREYPGTLAPVSIVPYGFPDVNPGKVYNTDNDKPVRLLFIGGLSQRKGIANVFEAAEALGNSVELTIVGNKTGGECPALDAALSRHKWIPSLPHSAVLELMREHDILLFPSLFEGFGLVITEAMSQGTPVITTDRTAGPDLIEHGRNGWLVEAGSTASLRALLEKVATDRAQIESAGRAALETAAKRPWSSYGRELAEIVSGLID